MGIPKPDGPYAAQLLERGGWTEADEDQLYNVVNEATQALQQLASSAFDPRQREVPKHSTEEPLPLTSRAAPPGPPQSRRTARWVRRLSPRRLSGVYMRQNQGGPVMPASSAQAPPIRRQRVRPVANSSMLAHACELQICDRWVIRGPVNFAAVM